MLRSTHAIHARGDSSVRGHVARTARRDDGDGRMREWRRRARAPLGGGGGSAGTVCRGQEESGRGVARAHPAAEQVKAIDAQQAFVLVETKAVRQELDQLQKEVGQVASALRELRLAVEDVERKAAAAVRRRRSPGREGALEASPEKLYASAMASFRSEELRASRARVQRARGPVPAASARVELAVLDRRGLLSAAATSARPSSSSRSWPTATRRAHKCRRRC